MAVLVVLPLLLFVLPAAFGDPSITGDNLIQNFPLRVLTGLQLRQGHLPLWNPYIWSGSPLLGGLNAGSFYPFTFFFAVLAPVAAFVVNLLGVYWAGGLGMYALARQYGLRPVASFVGAITYAFSGAMSSQIVHLGVVQGMGWMPLLVLAELRLSWGVLGTGPVLRSGPVRSGPVRSGPARAGRDERDERDDGDDGDDGDGAVRGGSPWPWVALLALVVGLEALTGEPRAMAETEVVGSAITVWLLLRRYPGARVTGARRARFLGLVALAGAWGVALAAAELAPGWTFIRASQRAVETYQYFGAGSLRPSWSLLLLVPDLFGGAGHFGSPHFLNSYNLPEVTGYVGLLPIGAALALLVRSFGRGRAARASDWGMWLALSGFGLLLAWGSFTPLGHLWAAIPLFGRTRLQSRNLEIVDLALAMLFAFWADRALAGRRAAAERGPRRPWSRRDWRTRVEWREWRTWLPAAPALAAVLLCVITLAAPGPVEEWLGVSAADAGVARRMWPWFLAQAVVAGAVIALVVGWRRLGAAARRRALVSVVAADLVFFLLVTSPAAPIAATFEPTHAAAAAVLGTDGRFAIVDSTGYSHQDTLSTIGQPDLNAFTRLQSVQGYGSILSEGYADATGTHTIDLLNVCALETGTFAQLRLATLLAAPRDLVVGTAPAGPTPAPMPTPTTCRGAPAPGSAHRRTFYLGWPVALSAATLVAAPGSRHAGTPKVGVVTADGGTRWPAETVARTPTGWSVRFRHPQTSAGIVVEGPARAIADASAVDGVTGGRWAFDGPLQNALDTSSWRFVGTYDSGRYGIFRRTTPPRPPVWLADPVTGSSVRQLAAPDWGGATDRVVATRTVTVVWSESYLPGWHATLTPVRGSRAGARAGASTMAPEVHQDGLIQSVRVPAGTWTLTFHYRPRLLTLGIVGSSVAVAGLVVLVGLVGVTAVTRRRRRRAPSGVSAASR